MEDSVKVLVERWPWVEIPSELLVSEAVPRSAKLTYAFLLLWGRDHGNVYTGRDKIAKAAGLSRASLFSHLQALEDSGWIQREETAIRVKLVQKSGLKGSGNLDPVVQPAGLKGSRKLDTQGDKRKETKERRSPLSKIHVESEELASALELLADEAHPDADRDRKKLRSLAQSARSRGALSKKQAEMAADMAGPIAEWNRPRGHNGVMPTWTDRAKGVKKASELVRELAAGLGGA